MSRLLRRVVVLGAIAGVVYAVWRLVAARAESAGEIGAAAPPLPLPPVPVPGRPESANALELPGPSVTDPSVDAVDPDADGGCPVGFPIKGKLSTGIYHPPGAFAYDRTRADRCYRDETAAESDGLRAAKR